MLMESGVSIKMAICGAAGADTWLLRGNCVALFGRLNSHGLTLMNELRE